MGDTVFGHVCWGIARRKGNEGLDEFLSECSRPGDPAFAVSSAFPQGYLPRPILREKEQEDESLSEYSSRKKKKKARYIPADYFLKNEKFTPELRKALLEDRGEVFQVNRIRSTIGWISGTTGDENLFLLLKHYKNAIDHMSYPISCGAVSQYLAWAFEGRFRAGASTGRGRINLIGVEEINIPEQGTVALEAFVQIILERTRFD